MSAMAVVTRWWWIRRGLAAAALAFVLLVGWLAITAPLSKSPQPIGFGLPENLLQIAALEASARTPEQTKAAFDYFKSLDAEFKKKVDAVTAAKKPLPEDPKLVELRTNLKEAEKPLPIDPQLTRLKRAVDLSKDQLGHKRLTIAQDYAWALINSPAFLFNR